ncbi:MAG: rhombosortase [Burkholderiales bacterium]
MGAAPPLGRVPWWTLGLVAAAILVWIVPGAANLFVYDRVAIAEGQWWRLLAGHLVHFSGAHLLNNLAVLAPAAWLAETRSRTDAGLLVVMGALAIGVVLWISEPHLMYFAGASGIAIALLVYGALRGMHEPGPWRLVCALVLAVTGAKLVAEYFFDWTPAHWQATADFIPVWQSHIAGLCMGLAVYLWRIFFKTFGRLPLLHGPNFRGVAR